MSAQNDDTTSDAEARVAGQVIDRLYDVAVDPSRYEELLDRWEEMIRPHRATANSPRGPHDPSLELDEYQSHFERADRVLDRVIAAGLEHGPSEILHEFDRTVAFALDSELKIVAVNVAATAAMGITTGADLRDLPLDPDDLEGLANGADRMLRSGQDAPQLLRGRLEGDDRAILFHLRLIRPDGAEPYLVVASSELRWPDGYSDVLSAAFGLTEAELAVMRALTEGLSLKEAALARGRSLDTLRAQLKAVMAKTETRSQSELVRLTLSMMELVSHSETTTAQLPHESTGMGTLIDAPFQQLQLNATRHMDYLILGDPNGRPVIYLPLDYGLVRWPSSAEADAAKRGLRVVVPVRAGYGTSTPLERSDDQTRAIVEDLAALMDHLDIAKAPILSLGGDFHFAAAFHGHYPSRVSAVIAAAGVLPLDRPEQYERMDKWHRFILAGARYTPHLLPFMVKAGFALARRIGKRGFMHAVYGKSPADIATFELPEVYEAMVCGSDVCLSDTHSAHNAFAREVIQHETTDWSHYVRAMEGSVPVHFFNGHQDPQVSRKTLDDHRATYPWIDYQEFPDAGQLIFFLKWRQILKLLDSYAS